MEPSAIKVDGFFYYIAEQMIFVKGNIYHHFGKNLGTCF